MISLKLLDNKIRLLICRICMYELLAIRTHTYIHCGYPCLLCLYADIVPFLHCRSSFICSTGKKCILCLPQLINSKNVVQIIKQIKLACAYSKYIWYMHLNFFYVMQVVLTIGMFIYSLTKYSELPVQYLYMYVCISMCSLLEPCHSIYAMLCSHDPVPVVL